jgi:alanyl-tRNA synthetase
VVRFFPEHDAAFVKLLAQKLTAGQRDVVALLASGAGQPTLVFAQSPGQKFNMGLLLKDALVQLGGRGGGTADMAQGGLPLGATNIAQMENVLRETAAKL